jgi:hypothetical protein
MNALVTIDTLTPATVFVPGGVEAIVSKLETEVRAIKTDISTDAGRKEIASLAYKVARSKTALDDMGKNLVADIKAQAGKIDADRRIIRDRLDALKDEVRKPLTDWENAEKDRIAGHEEALAAIVQMGSMVDPQPTAESIKLRIVALSELPVRDWQEFGKRAAEALKSSLDSLTAALALAEKREAEAAELARLRAEQFAREQKERDDRIATEAAEKARIEAEIKARREAEEVAAKADAERKRVEQEKAEAIARAEKAEADRVAAAAKAERDAKDAAEAAERNRLAAIEAERKRVADEAAAVAAETAKRETDKKHRAKINNEALAALTSFGVEAELGKAVIAAIARGEIPHISIEY